MSKMIQLYYHKNSEMEEQFYTFVKSNRSPRHFKNIEEKCQRYFEKSFKEIVCSAPEELEEMAKSLEARSDFFTIKNDFKNILSKSSSGKNNEYISKVLYETMPVEARKLVYNIVGQKVCPYCNRNYIDEIRESIGKRTTSGTFELDHFYSRDDFPMFAVSIYNLIPVCGVCNSLKSNVRFKINPYLMQSTDEISFSYHLVGANFKEEEDDLVIDIKNSRNSSEDIDNLHLEELYNGHKDVAQEIIKKTEYYNKTYIDSLYNVAGKMFKDKGELYRLLYGGYANPDEYGKRPLSKFIRDIYKDTINAIDGYNLLED